MTDSRETDIVALRELLAKASPQNLSTAEIVENGHYDCPLCEEGEVEGRVYTNYDGLPLGVQFFGIGDAFGHAEALFAGAIKALPALLDEVTTLRQRVAELEGARAVRKHADELAIRALGSKQT